MLGNKAWLTVGVLPIPRGQGSVQDSQVLPTPNFKNPPIQYKKFTKMMGFSAYFWPSSAGAENVPATITSSGVRSQLQGQVVALSLQKNY